MLALEEGGEHARALRRFASSLPLPRAIVVVSAHFEEPGPIRVTSGERPETIHDFGGFPPALYRLSYPAPGAPALARAIVARLEAADLPATADPARGFDHGVWVPLRLAFPRAEVPVIAVSLPEPRTPGEVLRMGRALAPLRDEGALLVGSGVIVHNLRRARLDRRDGPVDGWAREFDGWIAGRVAARDVEALLGYRDRAPHAALAVPTPEHFDPLFFVLGTARDGDRLETVAEGFEYGNLSMRSFALRPASQPEGD
jgi:4,5-DOPA dioxygenase extradiol